MITRLESVGRAYRLPLDESLYALEESDAKFLKAYLGILDDEDLKKHILHIQAEAYAVSTLDVGISLLNV